jgi:putative ATP-dependent endonuclease of OLD family
VQVAAVDNADPVANAELRVKSDVGEAAPLHHQSDGVRALSSIVVQRLAAPAAIVAIDEPEIHLHPRSQARLAHLLATGSGQRIVATHAASVLAAFDPTDVVGLCDGDIRQISATNARRDPKFFTQWWTDAAVEPLTSNVVALVEGPSDRVLLVQAARLLGYDLDQHGCSVVVAHGAPTFRPLLRLYGARGFGLNVVGMIDEDEAPIIGAALKCGHDEASLRAVRFEVSSPDLEGECVDGLGVERHADLLCKSGLYSEKQILRANDVDSTADLDPGSYAEWCRGRKVLHAAALAATMEKTDARKIASLVRLLKLIRQR